MKIIKRIDIKFTKYTLIFFAIFLLAVFFRLYKITSIPPSPSLDEVTIGYNAYSLLLTGNDEYGYHLPILLRAYDDWRPALYVYLVVPFIKLFGLSILAVRLPSVLLSLVTIIATYFLVKEITRKYKYSQIAGLISMFLLSISPWHIYISRLGHEANAGSTFIVLGTLFFIQSMNKSLNKWLIVLSGLFFSLSFYTYQSEKVFTPLIVMSMIVVYWRELFERRKAVGVALVIAFLFTVPILQASLSSNALIRLKGTSAFTNLNDEYEQNARQVLIDKTEHNYAGTVFDNRRLIPVKIFLGNYISHFNPYWLYTNNGNEDFKVPMFGLFYFWEFPFLLIGLMVLIKSDFRKKEKIVAILWIMIAFIAPSITTQAPHAMRAYNLLPIPQLLEAIGIIDVFLIFHSRIHVLMRVQELLLIIGFSLLLVFTVCSFYVNYFYVFPLKDSRPYQYALYQSLSYLVNNKLRYTKAVISNKNNLYQSYMFYLFISKYDPRLYQKQGGTISGGFAVPHKIGSISFRPIDWNTEKKVPGTLLMGNPTAFPPEVSVYKSFLYLDGTEGVKMVRL